MKQTSKIAVKSFKKWGEAGGKKRAKNLSPSARRAISKHAAQMRWGQKKGENLMPSVRLNESHWEDPVYLEEILSHGDLEDWKKLRQIMVDHPFGAEAAALEKVLHATNIYGVTSLWKGILRSLQGTFS